MVSNADQMAAVEAAEAVVVKTSAATTNASVSPIAVVSNVAQTVAVEAAEDAVGRTLA